ncbi:MAG: viperin family antiviral radical SAM protein [Patescibacteria group bacterium]
MEGQKSIGRISTLQGLTVNLHITRHCNFHCGYCFAVYREIKDLPITAWKLIIQKLTVAGVGKINFAGGEPLLFQGLGSLIEATSEAGLITSLVTNGKLITREWCAQYLRWLNIIAISLDSFDRKVQHDLGRDNDPDVPQMVVDRIAMIREIAKSFGHKIYVKLNMVVTSQNAHEDPTPGLLLIHPNRVKIFQVTRVEGENEGTYDGLAISRQQFDAYVDRVRQGLSGCKETVLAPETEEDLHESYLVIGPDGSFRDKRAGQNLVGSSLIEASVEDALSSLFSEDDLVRIGLGMAKRGGIYSVTGA